MNGKKRNPIEWLAAQSVDEYFTIVKPDEVDASLEQLPMRDIDVVKVPNNASFFFMTEDEPLTLWLDKVCPGWKEKPALYKKRPDRFHKSDRLAMKQDELPANCDSSELSEEVFRENKTKYNLRIVPEEEANLISSLSENGLFHYPIIDLDIPHVYVPSSTDGHGHLYLNVPMNYADYETLLVVLQQYRIIGQGSVDQLRATGVSLTRKPDVKKPCSACDRISPDGQVCQWMWQLPHGECMDPDRPKDRPLRRENVSLGDDQW